LQRLVKEKNDKYLNKDAYGMSLNFVKEREYGNYNSKGEKVYNNFNDRFSLTNMTTYQLYGDVFSQLFMYSKKYPLHSETFHYNTIRYKKINIKLISFLFKRVRYDGSNCPN
jgi:hypothetical protein